MNPHWQDQRKNCRDGFGEALVELGQKDHRVVVLTADLSESTRVNLFAKAFPDRFIDVGVAEQNLMGIAAGLASSGKIPFIASYGVFSPGRNWDQLRVSVCYSQHNVKVVGSHAGLSTGPDGATHQALEDIAITRVLPNLTVVSPCDYEETKKATLALAAMTGPAYIRFGREATAVMTTQDTTFELGKGYVLHPGSDVTVIGCGSILAHALAAAQVLARQSISAEVINTHTIKPFDQELLLSSVSKTGAVVTVEEHQCHGGLGSLVCEVLSEHCPLPVEMIGVDDTFGESGQPEELFTKYHLAITDIVAAIRRVVARKKAGAKN